MTHINKKLIVNADDFGFTAGVNAGIVHAFKAGIVTSTTIMANADAFEQAVEIARANPGLAVGCHLSILGGRPLSAPRDVPSLVDKAGLMSKSVSQLMSKLLRGATRRADIEREFRTQVERVVAAGIKPTHLDTHKHTHTHPRVMKALLCVARDFGIRCVRNPFERFHYPKSLGPAARARRAEHLKQYAVSMGTRPVSAWFRRLVAANGLKTPDYFCGVALTGLLDSAAIIAVLQSMREGVTELVCHPGIFDEELEHAPTRLKRERERELEALIDPAVRRCAKDQGIALISYQEL